MNLLELVVLLGSCMLSQQPLPQCALPANAAVESRQVKFTGQSVDVALSAKAVFVWDDTTGQELYTKQADEARPIASLSKLLSALTIRKLLNEDAVVAIPAEVKAVQRQGADINLPVGQHATVEALLAAGMIASANDAMVTLAKAASDSEKKFVTVANNYAEQLELTQTLLANATGLSGGVQHSTAREVGQLLRLAQRDALLSRYLNQSNGTLVTVEGKKLAYKTTNKLVSGYLPIMAGKTGYTTEAGECLAIITTGPTNQRLGVVLLGSTNRFQDMKTLVEWVWRNYTWE